MRIGLSIFLLLMPFLVGCGSLACKAADTGDEHFSINVRLQEYDIMEMLDDTNKDNRTQLSCKDVCKYVYMRDRGFNVGMVDGCEYMVTAVAAVDLDAEAGEVRCDGEGYQYSCE